MNTASDLAGAGLPSTAAVGKLTVIVPCYNEARRLGVWRELIREQAALGWEWLFVNDGSRDESAALLAAMARELGPSGMRVIDLPANRGKGAAVRAGIMAASRPCVGYVDADLAASPLAFQEYLDDAVLRGEVLVLGIRLLTNDKLVERKAHRHVLGRLYQTLFTSLLGSTIYDSQCGFKLLATAKAQAIAAQMRCEGFAFDVELLLLAQRWLGMQLREVPIRWVERGGSSVRPWSALRMVIDLWAIRRRLRRLPRLPHD